MADFDVNFQDTNFSAEFGKVNEVVTDGGYYTPDVEQIDETTAKVSFKPSKQSMPPVADAELKLPRGANGAQGEKGERGDKGEDGYTPQRGTDYWTQADIAEIKGYVDDAILGGAW